MMESVIGSVVFKLRVFAAVDHAIATSIEQGRPAFIDGGPHVHAELSRRTWTSPAVVEYDRAVLSVGAIGGYRATTYAVTGKESWSVTVIEAPR